MPTGKDMSSPSSQEEGLETEKLNEYLKDSLFVDYFNAFLALPTFPFKVKYNSGSGGFEEIVSRSRSNVSLVTSEVSLVSLSSKNYTTVPLEEVHSKPWVLRERLPLFMRSDLYSEYRLCRLLDQRALPVAMTSCDESLPVAMTSCRESPPVAMTSCDESLPVAMTSCRESPPDCIASCQNTSHGYKQSSAHPPGRMEVFGTNGVLRLGACQETQCTHHCDQPLASGQDSGVFDSLEKVKAFKQFLHEKAGERNWLFWVDSERVHYLTNPPDKAKWMKQLKSKYLRNGSPLQLPSEVLLELGVTKSSKITEEALLSTQAVLLEALKTYWYPSFLVHLQCAKQKLSSLHLPQMAYIGPKLSAVGGVPRTRSAGQRGPMAVSLRSRSKSISSHGDPSGSMHGRPRSYSASEITIRADDFVSKGKQKGRTTPKLKKLKECAWSEEGSRDVQVCGGRGKQEVVKKGKHEVVGSSKQEVTDELLVQEVVNNLQKQVVKDKESRNASSKGNFLSKTKKSNSSMLKKQGKSQSKDCDPHTPSLSSPPPTAPPIIEDYHRLLKCLALEQWKAGGYFQRYLETSGNQLFLNCLFFWRELQLFKKLFYTSSFSPSAVEVKAKELHSLYIIAGAVSDVQCPSSVRREIMRNLWPTFEELFDSAEEHVLRVLMSPWKELAKMDGHECERKVLDSIPMSNGAHSNSPRVGYRGRYKGREGGEHQWTLLDVIGSPTESEYFKLFLNTNMAAIDLMCWLEIEAFRAIPADDAFQRNLKARQIKAKFLNKKYFFGPNSPASKDQQRQVIAAQGGGYTSHLPPRPSTPVMREAQKFVRSRLDRKWLPTFITQPEFISRNSSMLPGEVESAMSIHTAHTHLTVETQLALQSRDSLTLRRALTDQEYREGFNTYLSIQQCPGERLVNNLHFYMEVQKFKGMYHNHTTKGMLEKKMRAIVSKYLESASPPPVQVDLTPDVVSSTLSKARKMGPYMFREAQAGIFKSLMSHWTEFMEFVGERSMPEVSFEELRAKKQAELDAARMIENMTNRKEDQLKSSVLRFETPEEKMRRKERLRDEKEMGGGHIAIAFRLSHPEQVNTSSTKPSSHRSITEVDKEAVANTTSLSSRHSRQPSAHPQSPSRQPSAHPQSPSRQPSAHPQSLSRQPSAHPQSLSRQPSAHPQSPSRQPSAVDSIKPMTVLSEAPTEGVRVSVSRVGSRQEIEGGMKASGESRLGTLNTGIETRTSPGIGTRTSPVLMTQITGQRKLRHSSNKQAAVPSQSSPQSSITPSSHHTHRGQSGHTHQGQSGHTHMGQQDHTHQGQPGLAQKGQSGHTHQGQSGHNHKVHSGHAHQGQVVHMRGKQGGRSGSTFKWNRSDPSYSYGSGVDTPSHVVCVDNS